MDLRVVLVETRNPLNIGAAARAMSNFGFTRLRVVRPYDVAFREARSAVYAGAVMAAAEEFPTMEEAIADCSLVVGTTSVGHRELQHRLHRLEQGARMIRAHEGAVALLFGSEKFGLSNEQMSYCDWLIRIATADQAHSMNLGQAVALCLYELTREQGGDPSPLEKRAASAADLDQITVLLMQALRASGYVNPVTAQSTEAKVRRLVRRLSIDHRDAPVLLGMLRQILWKVGR